VLSEIETHGFAILSKVIEQDQVGALIAEIETALNKKEDRSIRLSGYAMRHLVQNVPAVEELAESHEIRACVETDLGNNAFVVRS
jgi:hypothetical protein